MTRPIFKVDVDLCVVDSVSSENGWIDWCNKMSGLKLTPQDMNWDYSIGKYYDAKLKPLGLNALDWWRQQGIYDNLTPLYGVEQALKAAVDAGYDVVFVSHIKGNHHKSKFNFLKRHFGDVMSGFIGTKEKHFVSSGTAMDIIIDDRHEYLNAGREFMKIKFDTKWSQFVELNTPVNTVSDWSQVRRIFESYARPIVLE